MDDDGLGWLSPSVYKEEFPPLPQRQSSKANHLPDAVLDTVLSFLKQNCYLNLRLVCRDYNVAVQRTVRRHCSHCSQPWRQATPLSSMCHKHKTFLCDDCWRKYHCHQHPCRHITCSKKHQTKCRRCEANICMDCFHKRDHCPLCSQPYCTSCLKQCVCCKQRRCKNCSWTAVYPGASKQRLVSCETCRGIVCPSCTRGFCSAYKNFKCKECLETNAPPPAQVCWWDSESDDDEEVDYTEYDIFV